MSKHSVIVKKFKKLIKQNKYVISVRPDAKRKNDGAVGNTLERELGILENNKKNPDLEGFEIKSQRKRTESWVSLFSLKPDFPEKGDHYMKEKWGKPDFTYPKIKCLRTSIYAHRDTEVYKKYKMRLHVDRKNKKLFLKVYDDKGKLLSKEVYWHFQSLKSGSKKLSNLIFVQAEHKIIRENMHFRYLSAIFYLHFSFSKFLKMIENGDIRYENRIGVHRSGKNKGKAHNHGGGFRIHPKNIHKLFKDQNKI